MPQWLTVLAIGSLALGFVCALIVLGDILAGHPQKMKIMNVVWPITPLYSGPLGLWAYYAIGRKSVKQPDAPAGGEHDMKAGSASQESGTSDAGMEGMDGPQGGPKQQSHSGQQEKEKQEQSPSWQSIVTGVSHCGAGCTLGDIVGDWVVFGAGWTIAGAAIWPKIMGEFTFAFLIGIVFQYFSIAPMRHLKPLEGIRAAIKADTLSITAYEVGMFVWMLLTRFVFFGRDLPPTNPVYWFMMQIAMLVGFATAYPMNGWLIKKGWKEAM